jgi:hypothetical protein
MKNKVQTAADLRKTKQSKRFKRWYEAHKSEFNYKRKLKRCGIN